LNVLTKTYVVSRTFTVHCIKSNHVLSTDKYKIVKRLAFQFVTAQTFMKANCVKNFCHRFHFVNLFGTSFTQNESN
jgi:hypothetical protein